MKKLFFILATCLIIPVITHAQTPVVPEPLPKPAWYTPEEIFNNVFSSQTLNLRVYVTSSVPVALNPGSVINVTGSTMTIIFPVGTIFNTTGSSVVVSNLATLNGSTFTVVAQPGALFNTTGSSVVISNIAAMTVNGSTVVVQDRFYQKISSGTSGLLTGITSAVIVVTEPVIGWSFKQRDLGYPESITKINPDIYGTDISLFDGDADSEVVEVAKPITFSITIPITSTVTYVINTLK